jgi:hypothetical protein
MQSCVVQSGKQLMEPEKISGSSNRDKAVCPLGAGNRTIRCARRCRSLRAEVAFASTIQSTSDRARGEPRTVVRSRGSALAYCGTPRLSRACVDGAVTDCPAEDRGQLGMSWRDR